MYHGVIGRAWENCCADEEVPTCENEFANLTPTLSIGPTHGMKRNEMNICIQLVNNGQAVLAVILHDVAVYNTDPTAVVAVGLRSVLARRLLASCLMFKLARSC